MTDTEANLRAPARQGEPGMTGPEESSRLKEQLTELHYLAWFQRGLRMGLRALWLCGAGFLLGWGVNALTGWLPGIGYWILTGLIFGLLPLAGLALSLTGRTRWVWTMDRRLELKEQVSTAWEIVESGQVGELSNVLVSDVLRVVPRVRRRMLAHGWFLERDLVAASIVMLLGFMVLISTRMGSLTASIEGNPLASNSPIEQPEPFPELVPTLPPDPSGARGEEPPTNPDGTQGEGPSGEGSSPGDPQDSGDGPGDSGGSSPNLDSLDPGALGEALRELGDDLSQQAPTYDLGQSLQGLDLEGAAGDLEELTDQLEDLSPETRERLAEAMQETAGDTEAAGAPSLSQDLRDAAEALQEQSSGEPSQGAGEALDQLAQDLRELSQEMQQAQANGSGAGGGASGQTGSPEPAERLQGEGGDLELPLEDSSQSGLLSPASPDESGSGTASGSLDNTSQSGEDTIQSPLLPNSFQWKWRDVVSSYFQR